MSKLLGNGWAWLAVGLLAGLAANSWRAAARLEICFLLPAVWCYYVTDLRAGTYAALGGSVDVLGLIVDLISYSVIGVLAALGLGYLSSRMKRGGAVGLLAGLALPTYIIYTTWRVRRVATQDPVIQETAGWVMIAAILSIVAYVAWSAATFRPAPVPLAPAESPESA
ncbi:hypothetical protein [Nocardioides sp.]|uniref:hypothetical protein n=1 Tax=Nocardioides sp. TaxID=35761 RepID=UPI002CE15152|nr:hypothetical protein [Nocardioides sp.]HXH80314.1 hypothetical protein [Nocardioides sp.]